MARESIIHASLNRPKLVMGIGSEMFGLEAAIAVMAINLQMPALGFLVVPLHMFFRWIYRKDPVLMKAYLRYMKEADLYDPFTRQNVMHKRPKGFGRGLHC